uniref:Uncharacterized protein n=1 Tax=Palpitomonas bilix TaxID=652834 RepID=A0A7S3GHZ7_9EUKA
MTSTRRQSWSVDVPLPSMLGRRRSDEQNRDNVISLNISVTSPSLQQYLPDSNTASFRQTLESSTASFRQAMESNTASFRQAAESPFPFSLGSDDAHLHMGSPDVTDLDEDHLHERGGEAEPSDSAVMKLSRLVYTLQKEVQTLRQEVKRISDDTTRWKGFNAAALANITGQHGKPQPPHPFAFAPVPPVQPIPVKKNTLSMRDIFGDKCGAISKKLRSLFKPLLPSHVSEQDAPIPIHHYSYQELRKLEDPAVEDSLRSVVVELADQLKYLLPVAQMEHIAAMGLTRESASERAAELYLANYRGSLKRGPGKRKLEGSQSGDVTGADSPKEEELGDGEGWELQH